MINFRPAVFETNSSSSHSISIKSGIDGIYDTIVPENGVITLTGGEFGQEWVKYNDPITKANYAAIFCENNSELRNMLFNVIKEHTGAKQVVFNVVGYIDHQSSMGEIADGGACWRAFQSEQALKDFIFSSKSWLFLGNDNESLPNFRDDPDTKYTWEVSVEGCSVSEKFQKKPTKAATKNSISQIIRNSRIVGYGPNDWNFSLYPRKDKNNKTYSSFDNIKNGVIRLFKCANYYFNNGLQSEYIGEDVIDTKEIKFHVKRL